MKYLDFVKNIVYFVKNYVFEEEIEKDELDKIARVVERKNLFSIEIRGFSYKIYGLSEGDFYCRRVVKRLFEFLKCLLEDDTLSNLIELKSIEYKLDDILFVQFEVNHKGKIVLTMQKPIKVFNKTSLGESIRKVEEIEEKTKKLYGLIENLRDELDVHGQHSIDTVGFYSRVFGEADFNNLINTAKLLIKIRDGARDLGLNVEERIYCQKVDENYLLDIRPPLKVKFAFYEDRVQFFVELIGNYFDERVTKELLAKDRLSLDDLANLELKENPNTDLDEYVKHEKLSEIITSVIIRNL